MYQLDSIFFSFWLLHVYFTLLCLNQTILIAPDFDMDVK